MTESINIGMVERMAKMETNITYIKKSIDASNIKFDKFVDAVDKKYATKEIELVVKENTKAISNINITMAKWVGGAIMFSTIITVIITILL